MKKNLLFVKLSNRWFVDIPWDGSVDDLEMVSGADVFLDFLSNGNKTVSIDVSDNIEDFNGECIEDGYITLTKFHEDEIGAYYKIYTYDYKGEIWLCNVTKTLFDKFPDKFYFKVDTVK